MGPSLLLLLLLGLVGQSSADSSPEVLRAPVGSAIQVQCHYRLQDVRARKVWCRFSPEGCEPLVSSAVDRRAPGSRRTFLTDLGGGLLQVEMVTLQEDDAGQYGCVVEGASGPQMVHTISLQVLPPVPSTREEEEETHEIEDTSLAPAGSASPWELSRHEKSIPLIWGAVLLSGLLVTVAVLFAVMARKKGSRLGVCGLGQSIRVSCMDPSSAVHCISDSGLGAALPLDVPHVTLDSPPAFDNTTYNSLPLGLPPGKPPPTPPSSLPPLPPKVLMSSKPVTYATVIFPGGDKDGRAFCELVQDPPNSQTPSG